MVSEAFQNSPPARRPPTQDKKSRLDLSSRPPITNRQSVVPIANRQCESPIANQIANRQPPMPIGNRQSAIAN
jgi:hypothetical protein